MFKPISIFPALALAALALLIAGCGGGGGDGDATITKAEFIKQADALCKKVDEREFGEFGAYVQQNRESLKDLPTQKVAEKGIIVIVVPSVQNEVEEIKALGIPEGDEEQLEKFFDAIGVAVKKTEKDPLSVEEERSKSPFFASYQLGRAYGFKECAEVY